MGTRLHESISAALLDQIQHGQFQVGERIPSTSELREHYGVSHVTVLNAFKVLADDGWIERQEGRGYFVRPQTPTAQSVATSAVLTLMRPFVNKSIMDLYLNTINAAIQEELFRHRYQLIWPHCVSGLLSPQVNADMFQAIVDAAQDYSPEISGIILDERLDDITISRIREVVDVPMVLVNRATQLPIPAIAPANQSGSRRAADYALRLGYDCFVLCQCQQNANLAARTAAFGEALLEQDVEPEAIHSLGDFLLLDHPEQMAALRRLIEKLPTGRRTLLFTPTDHLGRLICTHLIEWGRQPGRDIGLISFDALGFANQMTPHLTTIDPQPVTIGRMAVEALLDPSMTPSSREAPFTLALGDTA